MDVILLLGLVLVAAWGGWFLTAEVPVYEASVRSHLEVLGAAYPLEATLEGQVLATHLSLGREVRAGEVLVELDATALRLQLEEEQTQLAALEGQRAALVAERAEQQPQSQHGGHRAQLLRLGHELALLNGQQQVRRASIERLKHLVERHRIRAAADGMLGEIAPLQVGAVVHAGDRLASIIPLGTLRVVAQFSPPTAIGRIRPGQRARVLLDGFPWAQYGGLAATVSAVAGESREGQIRVELTMDGDDSSRIPLQHGLPGMVEIEVERTSPAVLALRALGRRLAPPGEVPEWKPAGHRR